MELISMPQSLDRMPHFFIWESDEFMAGAGAFTLVAMVSTSIWALLLAFFAAYVVGKQVKSAKELRPTAQIIGALYWRGFPLPGIALNGLDRKLLGD